ncbi:hypothetical protein CK203_055589 [Vitis vinifera]|uniref:Uncharacterized protein n=1 Tax=Vitis vinifera TaxID=29760 RepID=A0A438FV64_VITVI|nr:hypothetical protein CK203_055589 [Vitis vinifera]
MVDGFRWKQFSEPTNVDQLKMYYVRDHGHLMVAIISEFCVIVLSIITFIDDVTSLHVGFERIITPLRVICFTIILVFAFDSSISFTPCPFSYSDPFLDHPEAMESDVVFDNPYLDEMFEIWCMDSHIIISGEYISNLLCIPMELFSSYHDRLDTYDVILGHISLLQLWSLAFKATMPSHLRRLESSFSAYIPIISLVLAFRVVISSLAFRVHGFSLTFIAIIIFQFQRLEPSLFFSFSVQSHHHSQFRRLEPSSLLSFGVQSHHHFSVSAFRAIIVSRFRRLEPSSFLGFGIQSHHHFSVSAFRAIIIHSFGLKSHNRFSSFGIESHHRFLVLAFRAIITLSFGVRSHHRS